MDQHPPAERQPAMEASPKAKQRALLVSDREPKAPHHLLVAEAKSKLNEVISSNKNAAGLAIVVGNTEPAGVTADTAGMKKTFEELKFVVFARDDPSTDFLVALLRVAAKYPYPKDCFRFIAFYFAGHGGSDDGHAFVFPTRGDKSSRLFVEEGILKEFYPENSPELGDRTRLFFFDSCLRDDVTRGPGDSSTQVDKPNDVMLPPRGNILVAYATSQTYASRGNRRGGGYWTKYLRQNLVKHDLSLSTVLDITWEETVSETGNTNKGSQARTQGPHYISCLGLVYLQHPEWDKKKALEHSLKASGATNNFQENTVPKHSQETNSAASDFQERGLENSHDETDTTEPDEFRFQPGGATNTTQPEKCGDSDDDAWALGSKGKKKRQQGASPDDERCCGTYAPVTLVKPGTRAAQFLCKKPFAEDVIRITAKYGDKWMKIGTVLKLETGFLNKIKEDRCQPKECLERVVNQWIKTCEATCTWEHLLQAMESDDKLQDPAQRIAKFLEKDCCPEKYRVVIVSCQ